MAPVRNARVLFNEIPQGYPDPDKTVVYDESQSIDLDNVPLNGGLLLKTIVLSIDPYLRGKMRVANTKSYTDAFTIGNPIYNHSISKVLRSEVTGYTAGDYIYAVVPFCEYNILSNTSKFRKVPKVEGVPWSAYIGVCGMPGKTAYFGWKAYAKPRKGETLFVTTGAGPVGSLVIQLAKRDGLKVIASAGSDDKVQFMKEIGADVAFNYKTTSTKEVLEKEGPINIYWDHVGGEVLDLALASAANFARFIEVGMIASYNAEPYALKNVGNVLYKSINMQGFIVGDLEEEYGDEFYKTIPALVGSGDIKFKEYVNDGLKTTGKVILDVQKGHNFGKAVIVVAKE